MKELCEIKFSYYRRAEFSGKEDGMINTSTNSLSKLANVNKLTSCCSVLAQAFIKFTNHALPAVSDKNSWVNRTKMLAEVVADRQPQEDENRWASRNKHNISFYR